MIKRDTEFQPVLPSEFPYPAQFPMLIPTRILLLCMLLQWPLMNPGLWLASSLFRIHSITSIGMGPLHWAPLKVMNHLLQQSLQPPTFTFPW